MSFAGPGLWYATRAAGLVTLVLLTASTTLGILTGSRVASIRWPRFVIIGLHRNVALLALLFLAVHVGTTVVDSYTSIGLQDAVIPFLSSYHRLWLGLGAMACDLLVVLVVTSLLRQRMRPSLWRAVHWLGYLCWPIALSHGLGIGTDSSRNWVFYLTLCCCAAVLAALATRLVMRARLIRGEFQ